MQWAYLGHPGNQGYLAQLELQVHQVTIWVVTNFFIYEIYLGQAGAPGLTGERGPSGQDGRPGVDGRPGAKVQ